MIKIIEPLYPEPDPTREDRIVQDILDLMKLRIDDSMRKKVRRWLALTLLKASGFNRQPWWFTTRLFACSIYQGQDVFNLKGNLDKIIAIFAPHRLTFIDFNSLLEKRALHKSNTNAGMPAYYSLNGGQVHIWPAPINTTDFTLSYTALLDIAKVPIDWEAHLIDGIIGFYARHFDNSGLVEDAVGYTKRFELGIKNTQTEHFDSVPAIRNFNAIGTDSLADTLFSQYLETSMTDFTNAVIQPAFQAGSGNIQILANHGSQHLNQAGIPFMQSGGNKQP